jgi:hypothetical protein
VVDSYSLAGDPFSWVGTRKRSTEEVDCTAGFESRIKASEWWLPDALVMLDLTWNKLGLAQQN